MELLSPFVDASEAPYRVVLNFAGPGPYGDWNQHDAILGRCRTYEEAFFYCLNIPGTQDFYKTSIIMPNGEVRSYAKNSDWRNRGLSYAEVMNSLIPPARTK